MKDYWIKAFTHFTTEPDVNENYESLEKLGDKVLKFSFMEYYMDRFPYAEPGELNNAEQFTQSNSEQNQMRRLTKFVTFLTPTHSTASRAKKTCVSGYKS